MMRASAGSVQPLQMHWVSCFGWGQAPQAAVVRPFAKFLMSEEARSSCSSHRQTSIRPEERPSWLAAATHMCYSVGGQCWPRSDCILPIDKVQPLAVRLARASHTAQSVLCIMHIEQLAKWQCEHRCPRPCPQPFEVESVSALCAHILHCSISILQNTY